MIITAIDPGSNLMGIATYYLANPTESTNWIHSNNYDIRIKSIEANTFNANNLLHSNYLNDLPVYKLNRQYKLASLSNALEVYLNYKQPNVIVIENAFINILRPTAYGALTETLSMIKLAINNHDPETPIVLYEPSLIKKFNNSPTSGNKQQMRSAMNSNKEICNLIDLSILDEHAIDAIAIGYTHIQKTRKQSYANL